MSLLFSSFDLYVFITSFASFRKFSNSESYDFNMLFIKESDSSFLVFYK